MPSFQRPEQENIVGGGVMLCQMLTCVANMGPSAAATAAAVCRAAQAHCRHMKRGCFETRLASKWPCLPPPSTPLCIMCARVCTRMLNDQIHWNICGPVFSQNDSGCHVLYITGGAAQLKVYVHICPAARPHCLAHGLAWFHGPESTRPCHWGYLPLTLGQGDTGQGEGRKKNPSPPHPASTKMNQNWKTTCKVRLIQEHLQYADVFFCTLCLLNCLWLRASVMKLYVLVERAASLFQLGPGRSLLSGFCKTFFSP